MSSRYQLRPCSQASCFAGATALALMVLNATSVSAQTAAPSPASPQNGAWSAETQAATQSATQSATQPNGSTVALTAFLTDDGQPIDQGIVWHIFRDRPGADSKPRPLQTVRDSVARLRLEPGAYLITATFGRAYLTRKITVDTNKPTQEKFVLNAGGLKVNAVVSVPDATADRSIVYDVFLEERDQAGNRVKVVSTAKPGRIVRLNSGLYQIVSQYGDANARVRTTVAVEPGKLTEATLTHAAAKISFRLVTRVGGDALTDVTWSIQLPQGELVKETAGAVPTHILAAGAYVVIAKHQGRTFRAEFAANAGEANVVEVVAR